MWLVEILHPAGRIERKISPELDAKIKAFQKRFEGYDRGYIGYFDVLETAKEIFFNGMDAQIVYEGDDESQRTRYVLVGNNKTITIVSDPLNKTIDGVEEPRIGIYGGKKSTPDSGLTIYPTHLRHGVAQVNSMVLTGVIRAITFSFEPPLYLDPKTFANSDQ